MERLDDLCVGGLKIYQDPEAFCFGTDAVLLSRFASRKRFQTAADLCCGSGVIPLLLSAFAPSAVLWGVDLSDRQVELAQKSVGYNGLESRVRIFRADVRAKNQFSPGQLDLVTANPPYQRVGSGLLPRKGQRAARTEETCTVFDVTETASFLLRSGGRLAVVYCPNRLADLLEACRRVQLEPKVLQLIYPAPDREPQLMLLEAVRQAKPGMRLSPPIFLNDGVSNLDRSME